ncbi:hypothetical protein V5P93_001051 [Actinokineospora auranticolor]|uniref:Subtilisin inhibitor-like n=1 Tax=Actinokineospora auranticolor TaxID=155976 RepID=A0A2S6GED8_9PSEU|nr:hypothetical protein [Actinokineospora auranticolor]PPK63446.1 hypothetical protein CLV40_12859 [Actinokineospora auranticolor]
MKLKVVLPLLAVVLAGCSTAVTGSPVVGSAETATSSSRTSTTKPSTTTTKPTTRTSKPSPTTATSKAEPTDVDGVDYKVLESLPAQYCDRPFKGALGKDMLAVVIETPTGRLNCEQAAAILFDYYAERPKPATVKSPVTIGPMMCDQVLEPMMPQVVCVDEDNLIYSMWPQR